MMRNITYALLVISILLIAAIFAAINPGQITLDLAFAQFELQKPIALTLALGVGWLFGLFCAGIVLLRMLNERRKLRRALRMAEAEVRSLRSLPIQDAD